MTSRQPLLIDQYLSEITSSVKEHGTLVLSAPPGTGKTTRIPPALLDSGVVPNGQVVVLQPRRLAARSIAARIAKERGWRVGEDVGYQIRFDNKTSTMTKIRIVTEGILVRQLQSNPFLEGVGAVVLDEFHERSIHSDLLIAMLREIKTEVRPDLVLIVMSATLDVEPIVRFLGSAHSLVIDGQRFPVEIRYTDDAAQTPLIQRVVRATARVLAELQERSVFGHILCFLPGVPEIQRVITALEEMNVSGESVILPLHGRQTPDEQDNALRPTSYRKVIVATNIAETSLTIDGVVAVVDSGWEKTTRYDTRTGIDHLELSRISRAAADQRAGRAARTQPGLVIRCWSKSEQAVLAHFSLPEIRRVDLTSTILEVANWGCTNPEQFGWFDPPSKDSLNRSIRLARLLGAISQTGTTLTKLGQKIIHLPVHPRIATMLIASKDQGLSQDCSFLAAILSEYPSKPNGISPKSGNFRTQDLIEVAEQVRRESSTWTSRVTHVAQQLLELVNDGVNEGTARPHHRRKDTTQSDKHERIRRLVLHGYPDRVAKRRNTIDPHAVMVGGHGLLTSLAPGTPGDLYFVAVAVQGFSGLEPRRNDPLVLIACPVAEGWLKEELPHTITNESVYEFSRDRGAVICAERTYFLDLCLEERIGPAPVGTATAEILAKEAVANLDEVVPLAGPVGTFVRRAEWLRLAMPELEFPSVLQHRRELVSIACGQCRTITELVEIDWLGSIRGCLRHQELVALDFLAPQHYTNAAGRKIVIDYPEINETTTISEIPSPCLAVKLQEMFGIRTTPTVGNGRFPLLLHLLAPNGRPVQVTSDLGSFWKTTYMDVRRELRGRYPKHHWPDDPASASWRPPAHQRHK